MEAFLYITIRITADELLATESDDGDAVTDVGLPLDDGVLSKSERLLLLDAAFITNFKSKICSFISEIH